MAHSISTTAFPHDCPDACSIPAMVEGGRVTACDGDLAYPFTQGFVCHKVRRYPARICSPLCVVHPLRRVGKKGDGRFAGIFWGAALAEIAEVGRAETRRS